MRSPNYVHANAHCQQLISVAVAGNVVGFNWQSHSLQPEFWKKLRAYAQHLCGPTITTPQTLHPGGVVSGIRRETGSAARTSSETLDLRYRHTSERISRHNSNRRANLHLACR